MTPKYRILPIPLGSGGPSGSYAVNLNMSIDSNYVLSAQLVDQNGDPLGTEQTVDLPLESVVVNGRYDSQTQSLILVLDNGNEITIPVSGLISGLRETIEITDMTQAELVDFYTNYATLLTQNTYVIEGYPFTTTTVVHPQYGTILVLEYQLIIMDETGGAAEHTANVTLKTAWILVDGTLTLNSVGQTLPTTDYLATVAHTGDYNDLTNKPEGGNTIYTSEEEYDAMSTHENADYQLRNKIDYEKDVVNKPLTEGIYASKNITEKKLDELELGVGGVQRHVFLTQAEYDLLPAKEEGVIYVIEGQTLEMVVTFQDQSTATYNVVID